jgi:Putative Actinobacterial Holin-X, holin superfamily III
VDGRVKSVARDSDKPGRLLGQLAHELSQLVRSDIELAAAERLPEARRALMELVVLAAGLVALVFALAAATWAAVRGLTLVIPGWSSPLVVAGAWLILAVLLLAHDYPRRLVAQLSAERHGRVIASSRAEREQAEETIRSTAEQLAQALLREAETQGYAQPPRSPSMASRKPKLRRAIYSRNSPMPCSHPARLASTSSTGSRTPKTRRVNVGPAWWSVEAAD